MNSDIYRITIWACRHGLKLNETNTKSILVGYLRIITKINLETTPKLKLNDHELGYYEKVKYLCLLINKYLSWTDQESVMCSMVFAFIYGLKRLAQYLPVDVKTMLVMALALSHFNYCDVMIYGVTVELSNTIQCAQNYYGHFIFNLLRLTMYLHILNNRPF